MLQKWQFVKFWGFHGFGPIFGEKLMNGKKAEIIEKDLRG
jgi:hypothetical protein